MMDSINWRSSSSSTSNNQDDHQTIYLLKSFSESHPYSRFEPQLAPRIEESKPTTSSSSSSSSSSLSSKMQGIIRKIRRRFRKEKKVYSSDVVIVPYNSYTYSKNFDDQDLALAEPDILSRSFSSRFAAPSSAVLKRVQTVR